MVNEKTEEHKSVSIIHLDRPFYKDDGQHLSIIHILKQKHKFDAWLCSKNSMVEANCLLILCNRLIIMLGKQIEKQLDTFRKEGGFTEALSAERLAYKTAQSAQAHAPLCPKCGKPMIKSMAKKEWILPRKLGRTNSGALEKNYHVSMFDGKHQSVKQ